MVSELPSQVLSFFQCSPLPSFTLLLNPSLLHQWPPTLHPLSHVPPILNIYPYPYTVNVGNFISIKLTHSNFLLWKTQFMGLIESQNMLGFIEGDYSTLKKLLSLTDKDVTEGKNATENLEYTARRRSCRTQFSTPAENQRIF